MKEKLTVELSKEDIGELIKTFIKKKYPKSKGVTISFNFGTRSEGYYENERDVAYFDGASIQLSE
jgi:hypothetical protein